MHWEQTILSTRGHPRSTHLTIDLMRVAGPHKNVSHKQKQKAIANARKNANKDFINLNLSTAYTLHVFMAHSFSPLGT